MTRDGCIEPGAGNRGVPRHAWLEVDGHDAVRDL
jgi:hypothetical protein